MIELFIKNAPIIGTLFFFTTFCYVIFSVFKKGSKKNFDKYSKIPLEDSEEIKPKESIKK